MAAPTRFTSGVTNVEKRSDTGQLGIPDLTRWHLYLDDFDVYNASDWTITTAEAGTGSASEAIQDEDGGVLKITNDDADNDNDFLQLASETFKFESGKRLFFKSRLKLGDVDASSVIMGLQITDSSPLDVSDGVFFFVDDTEGDGTVDAIVEKDSTQSTASDVATLTDDTYVVLAFYYNGDDEVQVFVDDRKQATLATTNLPDDEEMTISFGIQNGGAAAESMSVDYIMVAKER